MIPWDAPIFMLPLSGMMFLGGAIIQQTAGSYGAANPRSMFVYLAITTIGLAMQVGAVVVLLSA